MNDNEPVGPLGGGGLASPLRIRLDFGYDGTAFSGWAMQPGKRTVEDELSGALTLILRAPKPVRLVVAGRTDAGVHARGAVVHADVDPAGWRCCRVDPFARRPSPRLPGSTACCPRTSSCTLSRWRRRVSTPVSRPFSAATSIGSVTSRSSLIRCAATTR